MATVIRSGRALFGASMLALTLSTGGVLAQDGSLAGSFTAPDLGFEGTARASAVTQGAPIIAGSAAQVVGQGFVPGQEIVLQRGTHVLTAAPVVADDEGRFVAEFTLPEDASTGIHPIVLIGENPAVAQVVDLKVSPVVPLSGEAGFDLTAAALVRGLYQAAYSAESDALFVTAAVGRPPVSQSALLRVDPRTLEIVAEVTPAAAPARPDGSDGGLFAVYGVGVDDAHGNVWVTNTRQNTIAVYSQDDLSLVKQFEPGEVFHSRDVVIDTTRGRAYVSAARSDAVEVFDTGTLEKVATINIASGRRGAEFGVMSLELDEAAGHLYTVSMSSDEAAVIDVDALEVERVFPLPGARAASGVALDADSGRLFVASQQSDNLLIVDLASGEVLHDVPVGAGALNVEFEPVGGLAYVSNRGAGTVTVVDAEGTIVANLDGGSYPNHAYADGRGNVYAVNKSMGEDDPRGDHITLIVPAE